MGSLTSLSDIVPVRSREHGGDNEVDRDDTGRPRLLTSCWLCDGTGRRPSTKVEGNTVKCQGCKGEGTRLKTFRRVTTHIDVLEDKTELQTWGERMVLIGIAENPDLMDGVLERDQSVKDDKDWLNRRAKIAKEKAGSTRKADQGSHLHDMSEAVDRGEELPKELPFEDVVDMMAYDLGTTPFFAIHEIERLVVHDELGTAGTPDRVSRIKPETIIPLLEQGIANSDLFKLEDGVLYLVAPDGSRIGPDELIITDLKTGRVDYGQLKMAMQLALYSRSRFYVKDSVEREDLPNINQKWGIIMHLAAGSGELVLYWADLELGWRAVQVAAEIHELRRLGRKALTQADFKSARTCNR